MKCPYCHVDPGFSHGIEFTDGEHHLCRIWVKQTDTMRIAMDLSLSNGGSVRDFRRHSDINWSVWDPELFGSLLEGEDERP